MGWTVTLSELSYIPKSIVELGDAEKKEAIEFLQALDDHDDVHRVYTALK
jgi:transcriptional/translational regulatory protein YebC/TACO1